MDGTLLIFIAAIFAIIFAIFFLIFFPDRFGIDIFEFMYLVYAGQLKHHIAKRHLVRGDLVFIQYRGALQKAYVKQGPTFYNRIEVEFADVSLNTIDTYGNTYHFSRVYLPEFLGKASKILYGFKE